MANVGMSTDGTYETLEITNSLLIPISKERGLSFDPINKRLNLGNDFYVKLIEYNKNKKDDLSDTIKSYI
jgi:hypothetical protein